MPKFGSHIIFAEELLKRRPDLFSSELVMSAYRLGSVGPDTTLFMFDPASDKKIVRETFDTVLGIMQDIQDLEDRINKFIEQFDKPFDDIAGWLTGDLYPELKNTLQITLSSATLLLKFGIVTAGGAIQLKNPLYDFLKDLPDSIKNIDKITEPTWVVSAFANFGFPFRYFGHPFTVDPPYRNSPERPGDYSKWWWMDMLHYRYPATFARQLLANASTPAQRSYALGYLTHVAGDTAGHPFINALVRGPFRNHAQRHMVIETLADIWLWHDQGKGDIKGARLDLMIRVNDSDEDAIATLIIDTIQQVYKQPMVPNLLENGYPTVKEWKYAYKSMSAYLKLSTSPSVQRPEPPPDNPIDALRDVFKKLRQMDPGSFPSLSGKPEDILKALWNWFSKGLTYLAMLATLPIATIAAIAAWAPRWLLYLYRMAVYYLISALRMMICLSGWGYCSNDEFSNFGFLKGLIRTPGEQLGNYPVESPLSKYPYYWLMRPDDLPRSSVENPPTTPHHPTRRGLMPSWMIHPMNKPNPDLIYRFGMTLTSGESRSFGNDHELMSIFGNVPDYAALLLDEEKFWFDFDLDGDRGNGYRPWEQMPPNDKFL